MIRKTVAMSLILAAATAAITVLAGCGSKTAETTVAATEAATTAAASSAHRNMGSQ